jgi:glycosyltransferase involved in cell wall biosynthesis
MKRAIVHVHTNRSWGGGEYQVFLLVRGLISLRRETLLLTPESGILFDRARRADLPVVPLRRRAIDRFWPGETASMRRALRAHPPLLLHAHDSRALSLASSSARARRVPLVLSRRVASPLRRNPLSKIKYSSRRINAVIAVSQAVKNALLKARFPAEKIHVVQSGVDLEMLAGVLPAIDIASFKAQYLLISGVGRLSRKKDWATLVRVAARLKRCGRTLRWVLAGDGPERGRLEALAERLNVAEEVRFLGFREDAEAVIRASDLFFFPSRMEGAAGVVRSAMLLGVPVVAADAPGTCETLGDYARLFPLGDVQSAAEAVLDLLDDRERRDSLATRAKEDARQRFDIRATVHGTLEVYRGILGCALEEASI